MQRPESPKPVEALEAQVRLSGAAVSASARSRASPVPGSDCSQKNRKQRCDRSSRKVSSSLLSFGLAAAAVNANGSASTKLRLVNVANPLSQPLLKVLA